MTGVHFHLVPFFVLVRLKNANEPKTHHTLHRYAQERLGVCVLDIRRDVDVYKPGCVCVRSLIPHTTYTS